MISKKHYIIAIVVALSLAAAAGWWVWRERSNHPAPAAMAPEEDVYIREEQGLFAVFVQGRKLGEFKKGQDVDRLRVVRRAGTTVYVGVYPPAPPDSYSLFDTPAPRVVHFDILNRASGVIAKEGRLVGDISPDGQLVAWLEYTERGINLILENVTARAEQTIMLPSEYRQFGDILFSPDSKKVAVAAAVGFPSRERGVALVLTSGQKELKEVAASAGPNSYLRIKRWKNNKDIEVEEAKK